MTQPAPHLPVSLSDFRWQAQSSKSLTCPVCGSEHLCQSVLTVPSLADRAELTLFACPACGSDFFNPPGMHEFSEIFGSGTEFYKSYVEVVAGIWEMYWPVACCSAGTGSLLDVGCGFGFTVDLWRRMRGEAIGLEMAQYGRAGAQLLDVPIHFDYLQNIPELQGRSFDVVYASEVIEHVPDPKAFAKLLAGHVAETGVLCLTTPNASFVRQENTHTTLLAALSPGFHGFLLGPQALEAILNQCGFAHVLVRERHERLVAWASHQPLDIDARMGQARQEYLRYLDVMVDERSTNDVVTDGFCYRHFKEAVLGGTFELARKSLARLRRSLGERYEHNLLAPLHTLQRIEQMKRAEEYAATCPWFLPNFYFVMGIFCQLGRGNTELARRYYHASRKITLHIARHWGSLYVLEALSFLPEAWQQEAICAAIGGDPSICEELVTVIERAGSGPSAELGENPFTVRQIEQGYLEGLSVFASLDRPEALKIALLGALRHFGNHYGDWLHLPVHGGTAAPGSQLLPVQRTNLYLKLAQACSRLKLHEELIVPLATIAIRLGDGDTSMRQQVREAEMLLSQWSHNELETVWGGR